MKRFENHKTIDPNSPAAKMLFVAGLMILTLAGYLCVRKAELIRSLPTVEALVTAAHSSTSDSDSAYTVVEYEVAGEVYTHTFSSYVIGREAGSHMTVAYNGDYPERVYETGFAAYIVPILLAFFGMAAVLVSRVPQRLIGALAGRAKRGKTPADRKEPWER